MSGAPAVPPPPCYTDINCNAYHTPLWSHGTTDLTQPAAKAPAPAPRATNPHGWTNAFRKEECNALVVNTSLSFSRACAPLLGGHPPAIHPVCHAQDDDPAVGSHTVQNLVHTVNLILARLRSCGVLAGNAAAQGQLNFQQIGTDHDTFTTSGDCLPTHTITEAALQAFLVQNPSPVLQRVLQLRQFQGSLPTDTIDQYTFTQLYTQALYEQQQQA